MKILVFYRGSVMWSIPVEESETWIVSHSEPLVTYTESTKNTFA